MANRYNQRITADIVPMDIADDEDDDTALPLVPHLKRNLLGEFGRPSVLEPPIPHEHMKVFLRIRPFSKEEKERKEDQQCLSLETERTVLTNAPKDSHFHKNKSRGSCRTATKFTFSHIFNDNTTQKEFFNSTMLGLVKDFIDGQNCLVFTYGVTSSGKTYTIQGNPKDAGILPRALDVLFNSINKRQWEGMDLKPKMFVDVTRLTPDQEMMERKIKERLMKLSCDDDMDVMSLLGDDASDISSLTNTTSCSEASNMSTVDGKESLDSNEHLFEELESRIREEGKVSVDEQGQVKFSVWVSFAEIYNEQIYDLLELVPLKKKNYRRPCLKLSEDKNGSPYIKGLKHIQVNSADEAYRLLTIGQKNLQTACTKLNHNSSRSHCIFNIKIIRVLDKDNPHAARVSMLTLCDLAGSERHGKTQTTGDRLKEAGNINTSLLTLGRCIETLRHNQAHKENSRIIPFRESKLTRLFQNFFVGQGKAAMIVNVNQLASMFDETMHVFKFSAIASKVEVQQKPVFIKPKLPLAPAPAQIPRTSISWATPARNNQLKQREAENVPLPEDDDLDESVTDEQIYTQENIDELLGIIEVLQTDLENEIHTKYKQEKMIRKEVCDEMMKQFTEIEEQYSERIRVREQRAEELAEKRLKIALDAERSKRKEVLNDGDDEWVSSVLLHQEKVKVQSRDETIKSLKDEINTLKAKDSSNQSSLDDLSEKVGNYETRIQEVEDQLIKEREDNKEKSSLSEKLSEYETKIKSLEEELSKKQETNVEDSCKADLVENLTQQLQQTRQKIKDQEKEISELNDTLTEAGETFEQKQSEIDKLKELTQEYETRMETQAEAIKVLERAAADGKVAMDTADQSLSKREECVTSLQEEIRNLEGDVVKYRNKARFFEEQIVEKELEANQWKLKYEKDLSDHASSQEALIHGFNAEISNLKSQIFHFKSQLYGVKSPIKSPGGTLKSPDVKMRLFPMSPLNSSCRDKDLNTSVGSQSPSKGRDTMKNIVNEQVKDLQTELDKNCKMIKEFEHALQVSKATVEDFEKQLNAESMKSKLLEEKNEELENKLKDKSSSKSEDVEGKELNETEEDLSDHKVNRTKNEENEEIAKLNQKIKELEPLMTDYFSTSKKLTDSERKVKELEEVLNEKINQMSDFEEKIQDLKAEVSELQSDNKEREKECDKLEDKCEEIETLNNELKGMVDKTASDLQAKEHELHILSPKVDKLQKSSVSEQQYKDSLKEKLTEKFKEIEDLRSKLSNMKTAYSVKQTALQEAVERGNEYEFKNNEMEIENQELQKQVKDLTIKVEDLQCELEKHLKEVQTTGEELAMTDIEVKTSKRMIEELKVNVNNLKSTISSTKVELTEKDSIIEEQRKEILELKFKETSETSKENTQIENEKLTEALLEIADLKSSEHTHKALHHKVKGELEEALLTIENNRGEIDGVRNQMKLLKENESQLKVKIEELENENDKHTTELEAKSKSRIEELENEIDVVRKQLTSLEENEKQLKVKIDELENENEKHTTELEAKSKCRIKELESEIENKGDEIDEFRKQLQSLEGKEKQLKVRIEELESENETHSIELEEKSKCRIEELENEIENKRDEIDGVQKQLKSLEDNETQLKIKIEELEVENKRNATELEAKSKCKIEELEAEIDVIRKQFKSLEENEIKLKARIEELEKENAKHTAELEAKSKCRIEELENEIENEKGEIDGVMKEMMFLKEKESQLKVRVEVLENENDKQISELEANSKCRIDELETELNEVKKQLKSLEENEIQLKGKIEELENENEKHSELEVKSKNRIEELETEIENKRGEISGVRNQLKSLKENETQLKVRIEEFENNNTELEARSKCRVEEVENDLRSQLTLKEVECETLHLEVKVLKDELAKETSKYETVKEQLEGINKLGGDLIESVSDNQEQKLEEIQNLLKAEKLKTEEYKKLLEDTSEMNCLSPVTGVRKLRKEKIEMENTLLEARYKITSLETKTKDLELKLKNAANDKQETVPSHDPLLQRKLNSVTAKLNDTENTNRSLIKEITELQGFAERLEMDLKDERDRRDVPVEKDLHRRSRASILQADPRLSVSSPSTKMELTKTRERELCLKEQLTEANSKIQEWLAKLSETENKLQLKTQELKYAQDTIKQLEARNCQEGLNVDKQIQEYMEQNNNLKLQILKKEGELECCQRSMQDLQRQLDSEVGLLKTFEIDKKSQEEMIKLLKDTLKEQEDMLQEQEDFLNSKEAELQTSQTEYKELLDKYHAHLQSNGNQLEDNKATIRIEAERDLLKKQLEEIEIKLDSSSTERDNLLSELKEKKSVAMEAEKKLKKAVDEKEKLQAVIRENNQELKAMECTLTEARKEIEELKSQGADKYSEIHLEEMKRDAEKSTHDLGAKIRALQCQNKELNFKLSATEEKVKSLLAEKHSMENKLQDFREERDKLVSGLEAVLKKKDMEIKQHKDVIKQMKEKEIQLTQNWQSERDQIAAGLQNLNEHTIKVKSEPPDTPANISPVKENVFQRADTPLTQASPSNHRGGRPPRPNLPKVPFPSLEESVEHEATEIQTLKSSPGSARRGSRSLRNTPGSETVPANQNSGRAKRGSSRRGKKRPSTEGIENLPPLPKRRSKDSFAETSNVSESDDYSSHLQVDATPPVAAKTLRRTRKKNGSQVDLSQAEETENSGRSRPTRNKRSAKHRLMESFRESPMGRTSKRILDSIAETFSPKSPTRSPTKSPLREDNSGDYSAKGSSGSKENVHTDTQDTEKKPAGRRRGRHKLYKEDTYISEPFDSTADFVQSPPEDIHKSVTRSLRSRRH